MKEGCQDVCRPQSKEDAENYSVPQGQLDLIEEIRSLRQEHKQAAMENNQGIARAEKNIQEIIKRMSAMETRTTELEKQVVLREDRMVKLEKAVVHLLQNEAKISAKSNDLEACERR